MSEEVPRLPTCKSSASSAIGVHIITAAVVGTDLDFTWKHTFKRGKRVPEVYIVSLPFGRLYFSPGINK